MIIESVCLTVHQKGLSILIAVSLLLSSIAIPTINANSDIINSSVTVPDHPGTVNFNPTSLKDIKAADPGANINLIELPQANNMGDARISYPIEIPPGRNGMQPNLNLTYNSYGGNGWVGLGWDLNVPSITVETRWGVPRYNPDFETETYLLNGEMLTPVSHRSKPITRTKTIPLNETEPVKEFHTRVEGQFQKILRYGAEPTNYWWKVIEKDGTIHFFGADTTKTDLKPFDDGTLADIDGNIFMWALQETRDLNGNSIKYTSVRETDVGQEGGIVPGFELYLKSIEYTRLVEEDGTVLEPGGYFVTFVRNTELEEPELRRADVIINARGGFKRVTAELLREIRIDHRGESARAYSLSYEEGPFKKTLLKSIKQYGEVEDPALPLRDRPAFNQHTFEYYNENVLLEDGNYDGFGNGDESDQNDEVSWQLGADEVDVLEFPIPIPGAVLGEPTALSGAKNEGIGGHLYLGFNPTDKGEKKNSF